jgi:hypothetical protein
MKKRGLLGRPQVCSADLSSRLEKTVVGRFELIFPQGLKATLILRYLRHTSATLRAGFKVVPFQNNEFFRSL